MKNNETHTEANRQTWDRRYAANRSPKYKVKGQARKTTKRKRRKNSEQLTDLIPEGLKPAFKRGGITVFFISH